MIARWEAARAAGTRFTYAVRDARSSELLGGCELAPLGGGALDLSYWTYPAHRRRGIASRVVALVLPLAFAELGAACVEAAIDADNAASQRVIARAGFREAGNRGGRLLYRRDRP